MMPATSAPPTGGRFDFEDGGSYVGAWEEGKAHGYGICTGPKNHGEYAGLWQYGFESSGVYTWPTSHTYSGQWGAGKRNGLGVENKGRWIYKGEWTFGFKGRYGLRESTESGAKYEGTWTTGLQDGYGVETYADTGTYTGQWMRGTRHGYGVRRSAAFGVAARYRNNQRPRSASLTSLPSHDDADKQLHERDKVMHENRGGFVLTAIVDGQLGSSSTLIGKLGTSNRSTSLDKQTSSTRRNLFKRLKKQKSTGDIALQADSQAGGVRNAASGNLLNSTYPPTDSSLTLASKKSNSSFVHHDALGFGGDQIEPSVVEIYLGEWKNDKRSGVGVCERSDGLKYEGEWYNNKKNGYGRTTFRDGRKEEGKYKNNVLIASEKKHKLLLLRLSKLKERIDGAIHGAKQAAEVALQKSEIASARQQTARSCAEEAEKSANEARRNADLARQKAREYGHNSSVLNTGNASPYGRSGNSSTSQAEVHPPYESKYADVADFRAADDKTSTLGFQSSILQDHFDRYTSPGNSYKAHGRSASAAPRSASPLLTPSSPAPVPAPAGSGPDLRRAGTDSGSVSPGAATTRQQHDRPALLPTDGGSPSSSTSVGHLPADQVANAATSPLVSTIQPKPFTRYSTVPAQSSISSPGASSPAPASVNAGPVNNGGNSSPGTVTNAPTVSVTYTKNGAGNQNHISRSEQHQRYVSQSRQTVSVTQMPSSTLPPAYNSISPAIQAYNAYRQTVTQPSVSGSPSNSNSDLPVPTGNSLKPPQNKTSSPAPAPASASTTRAQLPASVASIGTVAEQKALITNSITSDSLGQQPSNHEKKQLRNVGVNKLTHTVSVVSSRSSLRRRGSLPDVTAAGLDGAARPNEALDRLRHQVARRRELELAWRQTPVGQFVYRINNSLDWCNRHIGLLVVLTVLSINFLFICIFLSYYNNSFSQINRADDSRS